jgi:hypothetical protein|tara:strand:- start:1240 stop:1611 length:372 start_codon:yes stop_codon:yes gene_type:complete
MRHTHYKVLAFDNEFKGDFEGLVTLDLVAADEGEAISKAQKFVSGRNWYKLESMKEHDPDLETETQVSEPILQQLKTGELTLDRIHILENGNIKILPDLMNSKEKKYTSNFYVGEENTFNGRS